jgi:hypothetical protein
VDAFRLPFVLCPRLRHDAALNPSEAWILAFAKLQSELAHLITTTAAIYTIDADWTRYSSIRTHDVPGGRGDSSEMMQYPRNGVSLYDRKRRAVWLHDCER